MSASPNLLDIFNVPFAYVRAAFISYLFKQHAALRCPTCDL